LRWTRNSGNEQLCRELLGAFSEVNPSRNCRQDFIAWGTGREIIHYRPIKPWCQLILSEISPYAMAGKWEGISLLFPMEKLFESYVSTILSRQMTSGFQFKSQAASKYLVANHSGKPMFQLRPDQVIKQGDKFVVVLDTKWKLIDAALSGKKYKIEESDMYQLYVYGQKYLGGSGSLFLIYPRHSRFDSPLTPFDFDEGMRLWVVPFDVDCDRLVLPVDVAFEWVTAEQPLLQSA